MRIIFNHAGKVVPLELIWVDLKASVAHTGNNNSFRIQSLDVEEIVYWIK